VHELLVEGGDVGELALHRVHQVVDERRAPVVRLRVLQLERERREWETLRVSGKCLRFFSGNEERMENSLCF
jgi:hypothetical protein